MTTRAGPEIAESAHGIAARGASRSARTISGCCRAILAHFAIDPENAACTTNGEAPGDELRIGEVSRVEDHLAMTLLLPMPYGAANMIVSTIDSPCLTLPGMNLSPKIAAAAVGQPIGRLTGHPAFAELDHLLVDRVEAGHDAQGRPATILHFADPAEPLLRVRLGAASRTVH